MNDNQKLLQNLYDATRLAPLNAQDHEILKQNAEKLFKELSGPKEAEKVEEPKQAKAEK